jgi:alpha-galactosidase
MMKRPGLRIALAALASVLVSLCARAAIEATPQELATAQDWAKSNLGTGAASLPFSFIYDGRPSSEILSTWKVKRSTSDLDSFRKQEVITFTDPKTNLEIRCVRVSYTDYPEVEWTLYFQNKGTSPTPILENIQALDTLIDRGAEKEFQLHYSIGSPSKSTDYEPLQVALGARSDERYAPIGGRATDGAFPYFNLEKSNSGVIIAIGWPGQWAARFSGEKENKIRVRAGQELTHLKLLPGEEIRSPLVAMLFYTGDWIRAQNLWRHWMIAHNVPRPGGKLPTPQLAGGSCPYYGPFVGNNEENQELFIRRYLEENIKLDYWWIDAGWYPNDGKWTNTGTWDVDTKRFPKGLKAVSDYAHARDMKLLVWFEPERVTPGTWLYEQHPDWSLKVDPTPEFPPSEQNWRLLNLGNNSVREWVTDHVDKMITEQGIDTYRQDFNMQPLPYWRANDAPDRQGITENHYVVGYLDYWDELKRRHPNMPIDACASGGRRNDLETMRRSVPLWRSDYIIEPTGMQNQTYGISFWLPYEGLASQVFEKDEAGSKVIDTYAFRSDMYPAIHAHWDVRRNDLDYKRLRELVAQWRLVAANYMGDYYPLTGYDPSNFAWIAWQFDRPDAGEGVVQAFRRSESPFESAHLKLRGLTPDARYKITDVDNPTDLLLTGRELMEKGLPVTLKAEPDSAVIMYKLVGK